MTDITTNVIAQIEDIEVQTAMQAAFANVSSQVIEGVVDAEPCNESQQDPQKTVDVIEVEEDHPHPDEVLDKVEDRINQPRQRHQRRSEAASGEKLNTLAEHYKKPAKGRAALFGLPSDRPASQLLKNIFDSAAMDGKDGQDHINIHNNAETELGRFLDMNAYSPFVHPDAGNFQSVGGLWHYIQTRPLMEEFRIASGARVRAMAKKMKDDARTNQNAPRHTPVKGFRTIIADAMWHKVTQSPSAVKMMAESSLPFEHYFTQGDLNIRQYPSEGYWIVAAYEEIRRVIKRRLETGDADTQPDFSGIENMVDTRSPAPSRDRVRRETPYGNRPRGAGFRR